MKLPISVSIITVNEEANLARCLDSVADLASEIVVIDSGSTDNTRAIAESFGAIFEFNPWPGHVEQKNVAMRKCRQPWVLSLDADEALSEELRNALIDLFDNQTHPADGYWINRRTFYLGDWIWHAWYPEWRLRLIRRELGHWTGENPHDHLTAPESTGKLSGDLLHYSYKNLEEHLLRTIQYARIGARAQIKNGKKFRWYKLAFSPWLRFLKSLFVRHAWRDGWRGWIIAFSSMLACFAKYAFLLENKISRTSTPSPGSHNRAND